MSPKTYARDTLTPLERARALRAGEPVDRLRCLPSIGNVPARVLGVRVAALRNDAATLAAATIAAYRRFGYDTVRVFTDLYVQPEAMGAKVRVPLDETAHQEAPAIEREEDIERLQPHDPAKDGVLPALVEATRRVKDELGGEVGVGCALEGPMTLASLLVGAERLSRWMIRRPETAHRVLAIAYEASRRLAEAIIAVGATPSLTDAVSSSTVISPKHFREFSFPYLKRLVDYIRPHSGAPALHVCGQTTPILEDMADTGAGVLSLDAKVDLAVAKARVGGRVALMGTVEPSEVMLLGTPADVRREARACIARAWDSPGGFILASGCSLPTETPFANIDALMDAAREVGWPVDPERLRASA